MRRLALFAWLLVTSFAFHCHALRAQVAEQDWTLLPVPGVWEEDPRFANLDGFAWYRCLVNVPAEWKGHELVLSVQFVDNAHEAYFNGEKVGSAGSLPPDYRNGLDESNRYKIPATLVRPGQNNLVAIRVFDEGGRGGFKGAPPALAAGDKGIMLEGKWQFHPGDNLEWAKQQPEGAATFDRVVAASSIPQLRSPDESERGPLSPTDSMARFKVPDDLELDQVLAEPAVAQPVSMSFDERGRLWVVEYLQYPHPAGLKLLSRDNVWRAVYDKVPPPPPNHFRGADKITIHEDTHGDGIFDKHTTFVEGLNIATACCRGRGGVWVLNPPYLLFYPDKDSDDVPDGDPEVHLAGFGLEDTHSVVNSLCWGPDGWLYAAQGSTVSGDVVRPGLDKTPVHSMGQLIWRYHPETKRYEIFAEGGGNAFGVEIDSKGRVFSGHNGGDTRGFHYVQGGYSQKGFGKHGPLSNPYTFGYFPMMKHPSVPRFTHTFAIYEGAALPERHWGKLFGAAPILSHVVESDIMPDGSSFQTRDIGQAISTSDEWFRPVDIKLGPDGALYVADFYEAQVNHYRNHEGQIDKTNGRIYRLRAKEAKPVRTADLSKLTTAELIALGSHPNRWHRQTALRLLGDRKDASAIEPLKRIIAGGAGQPALEALWALNLSGGLDADFALHALDHSDPYVRLWTARLLCDSRSVGAPIAAKLADMARTEPNLEARSQLACSARRLPARDDLAIVRNLLARSEDIDDIHIPLLLWWAIEAQAEEHRDEVLALLDEPAFWSLPMVDKHILPRLMKRYALAGTRKDLITCAMLLDKSPGTEQTKRLMAGFEEAFQGRSLAELPPELVQALARSGGATLALRVRQGEADAVEKALAVVADDKAEPRERLQLVQMFGEVKQPRCVPLLLKLVEGSRDEPLRMAALTALSHYDGDAIGVTVVRVYRDLPDDTRGVAQTLLASRCGWAKQLLDAIDANRIEAGSIPLPVVRKILVHPDEQLAAAVQRHWGDVQGATTSQMRAQIERLAEVIRSGSGNPYEGKKLFSQNCGKCHTLFGEGGKIGPDLTSYKRDDLEIMLLNVVNPSAEIREGFENYLVVTNDGRRLNGFLADQDNKVVVLRGIDGQNITLPRDEIDEIKPAGVSLMPEGVLKDLTDQQVRDLFAYLRSSQPQVRHIPRPSFVDQGAVAEFVRIQKNDVTRR